MALIDFNIHNNIAVLTVNRPEVRNALNMQAMADFAAAVEQAHAQPNLLALIVTGAGKAFISGGDLAELHGYSSEADAMKMISLMGDALDRLEALPCITIAAMEGPARGGGCEIALACDWRVAAEDSDFGFVQVRLGLTTGWGGAARLARIVGYARALDLLTLGRVISASEAQNLKIVTYLAPPDEALKAAIDIADALGAHDVQAIQTYKRILAPTRASQAEANAIERTEFPKLWTAEAHTKAVEEFLGK
jgi:enoyl-CoA hydratase